MDRYKINRTVALFDGCSGGKYSLNEMGIETGEYLAFEIDPYPIAIANHHFPDIIQMGDVRELTEDKSGSKIKSLGKVDLLLGGSPCQNLSRAVINNIKHNKGLDGEKSKLFYDYVEVLFHANPTFFFFENVASMKDEDRDVITEALGVEPIMVDSNLFTAQDRKRYYWTNIPNNGLPGDKGVVLKDIVIAAHKVPEKYWYQCDFIYNGDDAKVQCILDVKGHDILKRVYNLNGKCGTLTKVSGGHQQKKVYQNEFCRKLMPIEYERLQGYKDGYTDVIYKGKPMSDSRRYGAMGNGWTTDVIQWLFEGLKEVYKI